MYGSAFLIKMYRIALISLIALIAGLIVYDHKKPAKKVQQTTQPTAQTTVATTQATATTVGSEDVSEGDDSLVAPQPQNFNTVS